MGHLGRYVLCWLDRILVEVFGDCLNSGCWKGYYLINASLFQITVSKLLTHLFLHLRINWWNWNELAGSWHCWLGRKGCRTGVGPFAVEKDRRALLYLRGKEKHHQQILILAENAEVSFFLGFFGNTVLAEVKICVVITLETHQEVLFRIQHFAFTTSCSLSE